VSERERERERERNNVCIYRERIYSLQTLMVKVIRVYTYRYRETEREREIMCVYT